MGLEISYYEKVTMKQAGAFDAELSDSGCPFFFNDASFVGRADGLEQGHYEVRGKKGSFSAGSYSGYTRWREKLAELVGTTPEAAWAGEYNGPFVELLDFSDSGGFIGPKTAAKLAHDFALYAEKAGKRGDFAALYTSFRRAFDTAAGGGAVQFR